MDKLKLGMVRWEGGREREREKEKERKRKKPFTMLHHN